MTKTQRTKAKKQLGINITEAERTCEVLRPQVASDERSARIFKAVEYRLLGYKKELSDILSFEEQEKEKRKQRKREEKQRKRIERIEKEWNAMIRTEFYDIVKTHYPISENADTFTVTSKAQEWKEEHIYIYPTLIDAKEKILWLCDQREYNKYDRTKRTIRNPTTRQKEEGEMIAGEDV